MFYSILRRKHGAVFFVLAATAQALFAPVFACAQTPAAPPSVVAPAKPAPGDTLAIGPGLFTFPQIAAMLSTQGQTVTCDVSMKDRAAFVFLKNRDREQITKLLGAGLQVEFLPETPKICGSGAAKHITMVRQKAVAEREAQWLKRLDRVLQIAWQKQMKETLLPYDTPLFDAQKVKQIQREIDKFHEEVGYFDFAFPPEDAAIAQKREPLKKLMAALEVAKKTPNAEQRMLSDWMHTHPPAFIPLIQGRQNAGRTTQAIPKQWVKNGWAKQALLDSTKSPLLTPLPSLPAGFTVDRYDWTIQYKFGWETNFNFFAQGSLAHQTSAASIALLTDAYQKLRVNQAKSSDAARRNATTLLGLGDAHSFQTEFPLLRPEAGQPNPIPLFFVALGSDAVQWWTQEETDTDDCLRRLTTANASALPIPSLGGEHFVGFDAPPYTLSDAIEQFAAKTQTEAIMELYPRAETQRTTEIPLTLAAWISPGHWSVREQNNVLLLTNRFAFLERPQNAPLPELLQLRDDLRKWHEERIAALSPEDAKKPSRYDILNDFPRYETLAAYTRAVLARRDGRAWSFLSGPWDYHGVDMLVLNTGIPAVYLWGKLPAKEQAKALSLLITKPRSPFRWPKPSTRIPLSRFSDSHLKALADILRENATKWDTAHIWNSQFVNQLRSCELEITLENDDATKASKPLCVSLYIAQPNWFPFNLPETQAYFSLDNPPDIKNTKP